MPGVQHGPRGSEKSRRTVPVSHDLVAALREQMLRCRGVWIFEGLSGGELQDARRFGDRFRRMAQRAGVPEKSQPLHALRTTFASNLLTAGVPIFKVSKWLGHSSIQIPAAVPNTHWSFSAYADGQNFYVVNDHEIDSEALEIILVGPETLGVSAGQELEYSLIRNQQVGGSSPPVGSIFSRTYGSPPPRRILG